MQNYRHSVHLQMPAYMLGLLTMHSVKFNYLRIIILYYNIEANCENKKILSEIKN